MALRSSYVLPTVVYVRHHATLTVRRGTVIGTVFVFWCALALVAVFLFVPLVSMPFFPRTLFALIHYTQPLRLYTLLIYNAHWVCRSILIQLLYDTSQTYNSCWSCKTIHSRARLFSQSLSHFAFGVQLWDGKSRLLSV